MLGSEIWYAIYSDLNFQLCARDAPGSCPREGLGVKIYTNVQVYIQVYFHIYVCVSLGAHNLGTFDARKLKFCMLLTQT